jgi:hypothetical protein
MAVNDSFKQFCKLIEDQFWISSPKGFRQTTLICFLFSTVSICMVVYLAPIREQYADLIQTVSIVPGVLIPFYFIFTIAYILEVKTRRKKGK